MANNGGKKRKPGERPSARMALDAVRQESEINTIETDRIVIRVLASGQVPYKVFQVGEDDYVGGVATVD